MKIARVLGGLVAAVLLTLAGLFAIKFDANQFLPLIVQSAQEQGFSLRVEKIKLALWPQLGLALENVQADSLTHPGPEPLANVASLTLAIPIKPLLSGRLEVDEIIFKKSVFNLWQGSDGVNNWTAAKGPDKQPAGAPGQAAKPLAIKKIGLEQIAFKWQQQKSAPLSWQIKTAVLTQQKSDHFNLELNGQMDSVGNMPALAFLLVQDIRLQESKWQLERGQAKLGPKDGPQFMLDYHLASAEDFSSGSGHFSFAPFNAAAYLPLIGYEPADKNRFKSVAVKSDFNWNTQALNFTKGQAVLDDTSINWQLTRLKEQLRLVISAAKIDLDAYLPAPKPASATASAPSNKTPLDLSTFGSTQLDVQVAELIYAKQSITDLNLKAAINRGELVVAPLSARVFGGKIDGRVQLSATSKAASLTAQLDAVGVALEPIWKLANPQAGMTLTGNIDAKTQWRASAGNSGGLLPALNGAVIFQGAQVRIAPLNITEQFCKIVSQATLFKKDTTAWPEFTLLHDLTGEINVLPDRVELARLHSSVDKLQLDADGVWERNTDNFKLQLPITLVQQAGTESEIKNCTVGSDYWVNRRLSLLKCQGKLASLDAKRDCGIDKEGALNLLKDYALYKVKKGEGLNVEKIKEKAAEKKAELKEKLKGLFNRE